MRFSDLSWTKDSKGFFYSRYPGAAARARCSRPRCRARRSTTTASARRSPRIADLRAQGSADVVHQRLDDRGRPLSARSSCREGIRQQQPAVLRRSRRSAERPNIGAPVKPLVEDDDAEFTAFGNKGSVLYLRTDRGAPNRKVIALDVANPAPAAWKTIVPEAKEAIESVNLIGGRIVAQYLVDVQSRLSLFGLDGTAQGDVRAAGRRHRRRDSAAARMRRRSCIVQLAAVRRRRSSRTTRRRRRGRRSRRRRRRSTPSQFETKALFATSKDGTRVPFFLTARKGLPLDGSHPDDAVRLRRVLGQHAADLSVRRAGVARSSAASG